MFKVLIADKLSTEAEKIFIDNGLKVKTKTGLKEDELIQELNDCDALVVRSATKATKKVIEKSKKLKVIGRAGIGVDNIDISSATCWSWCYSNQRHWTVKTYRNPWSKRIRNCDCRY